MIYFECPSCGNEFEVEDKQAGLRGRCPKCQGIIKVPTKSQNELEFIGDDIFSDKKLNALYNDFLDEYDHKIIKNNVITGEELEFAVVEILTTGLRSQLIFIYKLNIDQESYVGFISTIGIITQKNTAVEALRTVDIFSKYTLSMDEDNTLKVSCVRRLKNFDSQAFAEMALRIALYADEMEDAIFGIDIN